MTSLVPERDGEVDAGRTLPPEQDSRRWQEDNREALLSSNAYVARYGLPLARFRQF
ncbi:type II toxin-antitoxin system CcdA family antitoxin [Magnetospirillum sp. LM-5]|uniref:type II toxin-antitoxin system CcdA family antitoxin n=1 Tax=Magnetospirillum sp. LM-5 TaxID=2681466 RepID=UPI0020C5514C|nr:type II toxin-antitoxin system CcdA family antitoxin [Magnetospirillum sp. LM-5]